MFENGKGHFKSYIEFYTIQRKCQVKKFGHTVEPRLSGPLGTGPNSPDNRESG